MKNIKKYYYSFISFLNDSVTGCIKLERFFYELFHINLFFIFHYKKDYYLNINNKKNKIRVFFGKNKPKNIVFYIHGGGFSLGSINSYSNTCYKLSLKTNSYVIMIDYRLAPLYKFPIGLEDCYETIKYILKKDECKNMNYFIMGDSAGGNLALGVTYKLKNDNNNLYIRNILLYPSVNDNYSIKNNFNSISKYAKNYVLTLKKVEYYYKSYVFNYEKSDNILVSPIRHKSFKFLDKVLLIGADYDLLKDEGKVLIEKISNDNVPTKYKVIKNTLHGFYNDNFNRKSIKTANIIINDFVNER